MLKDGIDGLLKHLGLQDLLLVQIDSAVDIASAAAVLSNDAAGGEH